MDTKIHIKTNIYIYIVLLLFLLPIKWILAWMLAVTLHEVCHCIAVKLCGGKILGIFIGFGGAKIDTSPLTNSQKLIAVLSGPIGGLLPVIFAQWIPRIALSCFLLSMYNLLPLLCLDGGRVLEIILGKKAAIFEKIFLIILGVVSVYLAVVLSLGMLPLLVTSILWLKSRNNSCKHYTCKVQ